MIEKYINKIIQGHALAVLKTFPAESIDMVMTSPPFWGLRDYNIEDIIWDGDKNCRHEWGRKLPEHHPGQVEQTKWKTANAAGKGQTAKSGQFCIRCNAWRGSLGLEPTFDLYIKHLCDIFDEVKRVLKKEGTVWINLGDTYGGNTSGNCPTNTRNKGGHVKKTNDFDKCLLQIPARFSTEMCNRGWILRNDIIWEKDNCMPSSASDRFTVDYEHLFFFSKQTKYYFEQQFEKAKMNRWGGNKFQLKANYKYKNKAAIRIRDRNDMMPEKRNKRCVWKISTTPYKEAHFAVYPEKLCYVPIKAGCPKSICKKCKKIRRRINKGSSPRAFNIRVRDVQKKRIKHSDRKASQQEIKNYKEGVTHVGKGKKFTGYTDCGCNAGFEPGIVLDFFFGSGTTGKVAIKLGRRYIGIELGPQYIKMAERDLSQKYFEF